VAGLADRTLGVSSPGDVYNICDDFLSVPNRES
jgi:hypothetical protein